MADRTGTDRAAKPNAEQAASANTSSDALHRDGVADGEAGGGLVKVEPSWPGGPGSHPVTELLAQNAGALSPFGDDVRFPLPIEALNYQHPTALPNR